MPTCRACGRSIVFKPHPQSPLKSVPFDPDGEIHFATCSAKKKHDYKSRSEIMCKTCEELPLFVYIQQTEAGERLTVMCDQYHRWHIPMTPANLKLTNADEPQVELWMKILEQRWQSRSEFHDESTRYRAFARGRELGDMYQQFYGPVPPEVASVLTEFEAGS